METSDTLNGQIPLIMIHGAWLSASSWENYADYFAKRGFAVSAPEWPRKQGDVEEYVRPQRRPRGSACRRSWTTTPS